MESPLNGCTNMMKSGILHVMKVNGTKVFVYTYEAIVITVAATLLIWIWAVLASTVGHLFGSVIGYFAAYFWLSIIGYKMDNWL